MWIYWRPILTAKRSLPSILEKLLLVGWSIFAPWASAIGVGLVPGDATLAFSWFGAAASSTIVAVFLWDEVLKLPRAWRKGFPIIAIAVVLVSVWQADVWIVRKVEESTSALIVQAAAESKAIGNNKSVRITLINPSQPQSVKGTGTLEVKPANKDRELLVTIKQRMAEEASALYRFLKKRQDNAPKVVPGDPNAMSRADELDRYNEKTSLIFERNYKPSVFAVYRELQNNGHEDPDLAAMLGMRDSPTTIRKMADRLEAIATTGPKPKQEQPPPLLADVRIASQAPDVSTNPDLPYALKAIIQTNLDIKPVAFEFECDGDIGEGNVWEGSGPQTYMMHYFGVSAL
jgi:hypothetical protein